MQAKAKMTLCHSRFDMFYKLYHDNMFIFSKKKKPYCADMCVCVFLMMIGKLGKKKKKYIDLNVF